MTHHDTVDVIRKLRHFLQNHPKEAEAYVHALSKEAQGPAKELMKLFLDEKTTAESYLAASKKIRTGLSADVVHELDDHRDHMVEHARQVVCKIEVAKKIKEYVKHHPEAAEAYVHALSPAAQAPAREILKVFMDDHTTAESFLAASEKIRHGLPVEVLHELDEHRRTLMDNAMALHERIEVARKIKAYVKAHPEAAENYVKSLSAAAQKPARELIKIFLDDKTTPECYVKASEKIRHELPAAIVAELDEHRDELMIHAMDLHHTIEVCRKIKHYVQTHPEAAEKYVHDLSPKAQGPAKELIKVFLDEKTTPECYIEASKKIRAGLSADVVKELDEHRDHLLEEAKKLNNRVEIARKIKKYVKTHPELAEQYIHSLSAAAQGPAKELMKVFLDPHTTPLCYVKASEKIRHGLSPAVLKELDEHREKMLENAQKLLEGVEIGRKIKHYVKAHPEKAEAYVKALSPAAQGPGRELLKVFLDDFSTPECYIKAVEKMHKEQPAAVAKELDEHREQLITAARKYIQEHREHKH